MNRLFRSINEVAHWMKNVDPQVYEQFIKLLEKRFEEVTFAVIQADADEVRVAQGRARETSAFLQMFIEPKRPAA